MLTIFISKIYFDSASAPEEAIPAIVKSNEVFLHLTTQTKITP